MAISTKTIRCFISSPGDVGQERLSVVRVLDRLAGEFGGRLTIEPILWEHEPLRATDHFQSQIVPPSQTDIVICILWSRLGTRLPEQFKRPDGSTYSSGTEWEFEDAVRGFREHGTPDLLVYRKTSNPIVSLEDESEVLSRLEQKKLLDSFLNRWFGNTSEGFRAAFHTFRTTDGFERLVETHVRELLMRRASELPALDRETSAPTWHRGSPFRGLQPFDLEHAAVFFGRNAAINQIREALVRQAAAGCAFVLVVGASGVGKSSLLRAGLLPNLIPPGVVEGIGLWRWCIYRPGDGEQDPIAALATAVMSSTALPELSQAGLDQKALATLFRAAPENAIAPILAALSRAAGDVAGKENLSTPPAARLFVGIDQLEEIFTRTQFTQETRGQLVAAWSALARSGQVWLVGTMRSDFYAQLAQCPELVRMKEGAGQYDLLPPTVSELSQTITYPCRAAGLQFEVDRKTGTPLDQVILEAAAADRQVLPLLQFTLDELYKKRSESDELTFAAYEELGGLAGAIGRRAEEVYQQLDPAARATLADTLRALVVVRSDSDTSITGDRVSLDHFPAHSDQRRLVDRFVEERLFVTGKTVLGAPTVGLAHESILRHWSRVKEWVDENREFLRVRAKVQQACQRWQLENKANEYLLPTGKPLIEARELVQHYAQDISPEIVAFVRQSAERAAAQRFWRVALVASIISAFFLTVALFGGFSFTQWRAAASQRDLARSETVRAEGQTEIANEQRLIADDAKEAAEQKRQEAEINRQRAERETERAELARRKEIAARQAAEEAEGAAQIAREQAQFNLRIRDVMLAEREWQAADIARAIDLLSDYPPPSRQWEWNYVWRLCHLAKHRLVHRSPVSLVRFEPQGTRLLTATAGEHEPCVISVWDWDSGERLLEFHELTSRLHDLRFVDENTIVCVSDSELLIWNPDDGKVKQRFAVDKSEDAAISADGKWLACAKERWNDDAEKWESYVEHWSIEQGEKILTLAPADLETNIVGLRSVVYSNDAQWLAASYRYDRVVIWDRETGQEITKIPGSESAIVSSTIFCIDMSQDKTKLAAGDLDGQVKIWNIADGQAVLAQVFSDHTSAVTDVKFDASAEHLASASWDNTARVWERSAQTSDYVESKVLRGHRDWLFAVDFSPSGNSLATAGRDHAVHVWGLKRPAYLHNEGHWIDCIAWHPQLQRMAVARSDRAVRVWQTATGFPWQEFAGAAFVVFDNTGNKLLTRDPDDEAVVLLLDSGAAGNRRDPIPCRGHAGSVKVAAFLADGETFVSGGTDGKICLWDASSGQLRREFDVGGVVVGVAPDATGTNLVIGLSDGRVVLHASENGQQIRSFSGLSLVLAVAISADGKWIAAGGGEFGQPGELAIWNIADENPVYTLRAHHNVVSAVKFHPNSTRLFSGSYDRTIRVWDVQRGLEMLNLRGHGREITTLDITRDGNILASADRLGVVRFWDAAAVEEADAGKEVPLEVD